MIIYRNGVSEGDPACLFGDGTASAVPDAWLDAAPMTDLYFCAGDNKRFAQIAIDAGLRYGARLPTRVHYPIQFADQNWMKPDLSSYSSSIRQHRPQLATVLDWEQEEQLSEVLTWAEEIAPYVETIIVIPKVYGGIPLIPERIGGKAIRLGIPCGPQQGKAPPLWEFERRPVHVLGGQPHRQMALARYLNVVSVDCSVTAYMARLKCAYWTERKEKGAKSRYWAQLQEIGLGNFGRDSLYEAFSRSCSNIVKAWAKFDSYQ
jgi:hypothetical protein